MKEQEYDKLLNIKTGDRQIGFHRSFHYHRYEPTPYAALEELFQHYELKRRDRVVDFGCGKGRLNFFIHHLFQTTVVGMEMNDEFYGDCMKNLSTYREKTKIRNDSISFCHCLAEDYDIHPEDNRFYFFNPFSVQIFMKVINNILSSVEAFPRDIEILLYYSSDDYVHYLEEHPLFQLRKEVSLTGQFEQNAYERFLVYGLMY
ncbi:SAM-dependent methyltransferase [Rossellomorea sp. SC111]|uniref:SAM-dependent methyltransferase n=1 Tax=Rossellomorea sp. SC111 TaxID=2968985 RepID=UPI00215B709A|nr:SAM-dependent methyltransferase [Rossellomorea sp. SC111]MCR8849793.1 SAM-dependent methyltransferase [Rossellomorea sp. SC111]